MTLFLLVLFGFLALQNFLGYILHTRQYREVLKKTLGRGIVGVGRKRAFFTPGELVVLLYQPRNDRTLGVYSLRGYTIFSRFREAEACEGLSLEALRLRGIQADRLEFPLWRRLWPYRSGGSFRKGALIQAVEAVEQYLRRRAPVPAASKDAALPAPLTRETALPETAAGEAPEASPALPGPPVLSVPPEVSTLRGISWTAPEEENGA
jgi:DNA-binding transcriptional regulator of glucitol operon